MKRFILFFIAFSLFFQTKIVSQVFKNTDFSLSVSPAILYTSGYLGEILYYSKSYDESKKISFLEWQKNLFLYGAKIESRYKRFHFDSSFYTSIRGLNSGVMKDSDWLNTENYEMKTTYSVGDNKIAENYDFGAEFYFDFNPKKNITISPSISVQYQYDSFKRGDSKGWYGESKYSKDGKMHWWYEEQAQEFPYYDTNTGKNYKLAGADYYRHSVLTWIGIRFAMKISENFKINYGFEIAPFSYFYAIDTHWGRDNSTMQFYGKHYKQIQYGIFPNIKMSLSSTIKLSDFFDINLIFISIFNTYIPKGTLSSDYIDGDKQNKYYRIGQATGIFDNTVYFGIGFKFKIL
ncbi:hypothetical protein [Treponema pectinovorum]|uniref:hypothetical protein n=1 Tax=Treponema pectinovorum TaxID=164 RepID=UPI0011C933C6|nr:hypothetical protein [Treponema pectinovorum]